MHGAGSWVWILLSSCSLGVLSCDPPSLGSARSNLLKLLLSYCCRMQQTARFNPDIERSWFWTITVWELVAVYTKAQKAQTNEMAVLNLGSYSKSDSNSSSLQISTEISFCIFFFNALWWDFTHCFEKYFNHSVKAVLGALPGELNVLGTSCSLAFSFS